MLTPYSTIVSDSAPRVVACVGCCHPYRRSDCVALHVVSYFLIGQTVNHVSYFLIGQSGNHVSFFSIGQTFIHTTYFPLSPTVYQCCVDHMLCLQTFQFCSETLFSLCTPAIVRTIRIPFIFPCPVICITLCPLSIFCCSLFLIFF